MNNILFSCSRFKRKGISSFTQNLEARKFSLTRPITIKTPNRYLPGHFTAREPMSRYHLQIHLFPRLLAGSAILIPHRVRHGRKGKDLPGLFVRRKHS